MGDITIEFHQQLLPCCIKGWFSLMHRPMPPEVYVNLLEASNENHNKVYILIQASGVSKMQIYKL